MVATKGAKDRYLKKILEKIKQERNLDFSQYRERILARRVMARVRMNKRENFEEYYAYLRFHSEEMDSLMDAMTINVTEFFRDKDVYDVIENKVIPEMLSRKKRLKSHTIRIWSCGSSSGEEAYSVLILLAEALGTKLANYTLNIYGTDIDSQALAKAREGVYETRQFKNLTKEKTALIDKYFYDVGNGRFWIREGYPPYMNFMYHDVIDDVPIDCMDIILCRNLLIYFDRRLQEQVFEHFRMSLNKGGFLILGKVESLSGRVKDEFIEYDRNARIYSKR